MSGRKNTLTVQLVMSMENNLQWLSPPRDAMAIPFFLIVQTMALSDL